MFACLDKKSALIDDVLRMTSQCKKCKFDSGNRKPTQIIWLFTFSCGSSTKPMIKV